MEPRYCIITPVRNEGKFLRDTVNSVTAQTHVPLRWIIVDDGSSDDTAEIADEAARHYDWISVVHRSDRGARLAGGGVMEAFADGLTLLNKETWHYLVKLDGDVTFERDYFERCFDRFAADERLGIGGGLICNLVDGALQSESKLDPSFHVRGATKIYKLECWQAIGGLAHATGWDTIDELKANMLGWTTRTFRDLKVLHQRPAGRAYGTWANWVKNGRANYVAGYHPLFMLLKCISRVRQRPFGIAALGLAVGFCGAYLSGLPQIDDTQLIRYLRKEQMKRVLLRRSLWA